MYTKTKAELFAIVKRYVERAVSFRDEAPGRENEGGHAALEEIERRYDARKVLLFKSELSARGAKLVQHLERALEDARAFERVHGSVDAALKLVNVAQATGKSVHEVAHAVTTMRDSAENRAWQCFEDWRQELVAKGDARLFEVVIVPPSHGKPYAAEIWACWIEEGKPARKLIKGKDGTSRVDALAHLASWCQAESEEALPTTYCGHDGPCGLGVPMCRTRDK